jgi:hypothetical protein
MLREWSNRMQDIVRITNPEAAAVFESPLQGRIVQTLIPDSSTLGELSRAMQTPMNLLHYHISKCIKLGLVEVERVEPRPGRPVKHYRATAKTFFVPTELLAKMPGAEMTRQLRIALDENQARSVEGVNFTHDGRRPSIMLEKSRKSQANAIELWLDIGLTNSDAIELIEELKTVLDRFRARDKENEPRHIVHMAVARHQL